LFRCSSLALVVIVSPFVCGCRCVMPSFYTYRQLLSTPKSFVWAEFPKYFGGAHKGQYSIHLQHATKEENPQRSA
jgi:hypothetical protein